MIEEDIQLTPELLRTVDAQHGCATFKAGSDSYVVMRSDIYRELLGIGSDADFAASLEAIREGWSDVEAGRTLSMKEFFQEFDRQHGLSN